jgi:hypothetical protein
MADQPVISTEEQAQNAEFTVSFDDFDYQDAVRVLVEDPKYKEARAFFMGDHWQNGDAWIGPMVDSEDKSHQAVMAEIEEGLVSHPAIEEVTDRHRDAVIGTEPGWNVTVIRPLKEKEKPTEDEQRRIDEAEAGLTDWWDDRDVLKEIQYAVEDLLLGARGVMRLFVPEGNIEVSQSGDAFIPLGSLEESLNRVHPMFLEADTAVVLRDPVTMARCGVYLFELEELITHRPVRFAELTYLDRNLDTVIRYVGQTNDPVAVDQAPALAKIAELQESYTGRVALPLNRHLTMYEMNTSKPLITEPILSNQKLLNMAKTMMGANVILGGFLERVILNGQMPGEWVDDPSAPRGKRFEPAPLKVGAGTTNFISGAVVGYDPVTKDPVVATPQIKYRDPVKVDTFTATVDSAYKDVLHGARQLHVIISGDAVASGESRKQARDDYEKSLKRTKTRLDAMGRWLLETTLQMGALFSGQPDRYKDLRVVFNSKIDAGPLAAVDRTAMQQEVTFKLRSRENYMETARVSDDPEAEKIKIAEEVDSAPLSQLEQANLDRAKLGLKADQAALDAQQGGDNPPNNNPPPNPANNNPGGSAPPA